jgi:hypothetical protein
MLADGKDIAIGNLEPSNLAAAWRGPNPEFTIVQTDIFPAALLAPPASL